MSERAFLAGVVVGAVGPGGRIPVARVPADPGPCWMTERPDVIVSRDRAESGVSRGLSVASAQAQAAILTRLPLSYLDKLQHENADDLAFYPLTTLAKAMESGHVIACEDNGDPAGYLWFGALVGGRDCIIYQAAVDYTSRRRYLGWGMVAELTKLATVAGCTGIRLKCASSAESNAFWQAAGFICTRVSKGGLKRGRDLNWYRTDIQPGLFTFPNVTPSERPIDLTEYQRMKREAVKLPSRFSRTHYR